jgi:2-polyprenyl-6-methoxyphenol hydroxylase-like FAD-dependent oxidoreductase
MVKIGAHAVVLGASMGGLSAARVLADFYDKVTVVERDVLPLTPDHRRGVPQGRHGHALLGRGLAVLGEFFPGFTDDLDDAGVPALDYRDLSQGYLSFGGHQLPRSGGYTTVPSAYIPSRPLLEGLVRQRLRAIGNVSLLDGYDVISLMPSEDGRRVRGATIKAHDGDRAHFLAAELVVDATGRSARTPAFLDALGYGRPREDCVKVRVTYASQLFQLPKGSMREKIVLVSPVPGRSTGMALLGYENDTWMLTAFGIAGEAPPRELSEILTFVGALAPPHVVEALRGGEPLGEVCRFRYPESRWRRYDKLRRFPDGLLVLGDAICSFNPTYGQGMTVAALQAQALQQCLANGTAQLARRFFRAAAEPIGVAWQFAVGGDLALPEVEGHRPLSVKLMNSYVDRLQTAAESDLEVAEQFTRVIGFLDPPSKLMRPKMLMHAVRRRRHATIPQETEVLTPS